MQRPLSTLGLLLALLVVPSSAWAASGADVLRLSSTATNQINAADPDPDAQFFNVKGAPPSIMFILDSSRSMLDLVEISYKLDRPKGIGTCNDPKYEAVIVAGAFHPSKSYPPPDPGVDAGPGGSDEGFSELFEEDAFYIKRGTSSYLALDGLHESGVSSSGSGSSKNIWRDTKSITGAEAICQMVGSKQRTKCQQCLAEKGYFLGYSSDSTTSSSNQRDIFSGKFLNFYPPRFVTARRVLKDVIWNTDGVRLGLAKFDSGNGASMIQRLTPHCGAVEDSKDPAWVEGRKELVKRVNKVEFSDLTPLARALFDVGSYFTSDAVFSEFFPEKSRRTGFKPGEVNAEDRSTCYGCQVSAAILISDGDPLYDGRPAKYFTDQGHKCKESLCYLDDVAEFFYKNDLQEDISEEMPWVASDKQRMTTYTIGFAIDLDLMQSAATRGGGSYQQANDGTSLSTAITTIINEINDRATTAASTSIATLQATGETAAVVPRFRPGTDEGGWQGYLYRFGLENELTNGCIATGDPANPGDGDIDEDGACGSIAYVDKSGAVVIEDPVSGAFVREDGTRAVPYWEAGSKLVQSSAEVYDPDGGVDAKAASRRNLWTAIPDSDGKFEVIPFEEDSAPKLMRAMGLASDVRADPTCRELATALGTFADINATLANWGEECAKLIIRHFRGEQVTHPDPERRKSPRPWLLADIFHSSPIVVEPPVLPQSCANFPSQCIASLWAKEGSMSDVDTRKAYQDFVQGNHCGEGSRPCEARRTIALVGSNGGFLHAFDMGRADPKGERNLLTGRLPMVDEGDGNKGAGSGMELWGFMPPDLLGLLKTAMKRRTYMVDGTAMVREVWVDGVNGSTSDGKKTLDEFRTVAVVGTGSGGSHFFALDLTESLSFPSSHDSLDTEGSAPKLLWMWPEPGSPRVADMGQTFSNFFPRPPPIGPVLLEASGSAGFEFKFQEPSDAGVFAQQMVKAEERWIVGLNGGDDPTLQRGRGFALVDVWSGKTVWEQFWEPGVDDPRKDMTYPITAGLALMDIGSGQQTAEAPFDGYFDTLTVGDLGGNVWVARMHRPGKRGTDGKVEDHWYVARGFQTEKKDSDYQKRRPITFLTSNALQRTTGYMRTFFGTGDRGSLLDPTSGKCHLGNLQGCIAMGCEVKVEEWRDQLPNSEHRKTTWKNGVLNTDATSRVGTDTCVEAECAHDKIRRCVSECSPTSCGSSAPFEKPGRAACIAEARSSCAGSCTTPDEAVTGLLTLVTVSDCTQDPGHDPIVRAIESACGARDVVVMVPDPANGVDATRSEVIPYNGCATTVFRNDNTYEVSYAKGDAGAEARHRFIGAHLYGGAGGPVFASAASAHEFDENRLSESSLKSLGARSSEEVTEADPLKAGWYLDYDTVHERTASPSGMTASLTGESLCVVWNSLAPGKESNICGGPGQQTAHMIQADFVTGSSTCLQDFEPGERSQDRKVLAAPPEPTPATVIGAGSVASGFVRTEAGKNPEFIRGFTNADPLQPIYQLELTNQEHQCRHTAAAAACGI